MKYLAPNPARGLVGILGFGLMVTGAGCLWGFGGALFAAGSYMLFDACSDEAVERFTMTKRGDDPAFSQRDGVRP
jgi:hypothetical protein